MEKDPKKNIRSIDISNETVIRISSPKASDLKELDLPLEELVEALNDPKKGEALIKKRGWTKSDLVDRASLIISSLASSVQDVNVV